MLAPPRATLAPRGARFFHGAPVKALAFSRDRRVIVSASGKSLKAWFARSGERIGAVAAMKEHESLHGAVGIAPDCAHVWGFVSEADAPGGELRLWDIESGQPSRRLALPAHTVHAFDAACTRAFVGVGNELAVLDLESGDAARVERRLHRADGAAMSLGGAVVAAFANAHLAAPEVFVWSAGDGTTVKSILLPTRERSARVTAIALAPDGSRVAIGVAYGTSASVFVVSLPEGHIEWETPRTERPITALAFLDGSRVLAANAIRMLLWKVGADHHEQFFHCPRGTRAIVVAGTLFASGHDDATLRVWDAAAGTFAAMPVMTRDEATPRGAVTGVAFGKDGRVLVASARRVIAWDVEAGTSSLIPDGKGGEDAIRFGDARILDASAGGEWLLERADRRLRVVSSLSHEETTHGELTGMQERSMRSASLSRDGRRFAVALPNEVLLFEENRRWDRIWEEGAITAIALDATGELTLVGTEIGGVTALDPRTGRRAWSVASARPVRALAVSPDGRLGAVAIEGEGANVRTFRVADGTTVDRLAGHDWDAVALAFSRDGRTLVSGGRDRTARVWSVG